jgi:hypothetical protein
VREGSHLIIGLAGQQDGGGEGKNLQWAGARSTKGSERREKGVKVLRDGKGEGTRQSKEKEER